MNKVDVKRAVSESRVVKFSHFRDGQFYYKTEFDEIFNVPLSEADGATLLSEDKALLFMRHLVRFNKSQDELMALKENS